MSQTQYPQWFIDYASDVQAMREAQQFYFQHKGTANLNRAKAAEKKVDEWQKMFKQKGILDGRKIDPPKQKKLF